jgi:DNA helicase-2/ATP-dependent DNA helicase PcrA
MPVSASSPSAAQDRVTEHLADATRVTEEQATACKHEGGAFIAACPGSGKTRTVGMRLAYRAAFAPDESVAAMSHTNTAVEEIRRAAAQLFFVPDHYFVGTLHTFLLRYIVYPLGHLYMKCSATPRVLGDQADWERMGLPTIGAPDHKNLRVQPWLFDIRLRSDGEGELVYRRPGRWPPSLTSDVIVESCGGWGGDEKEAYWKKGLLSYSDVPWVAYAVLTDHEGIAPAVAARFDELIVDEVQDTPPLQLACLRKLRAQPSRPNLVIVGDLCQSIYEWSDATPEGVRTFSEEQELDELPLTANFRSSQLIGNVTHRFSTRAKPDVAAGPTAGVTTPPELWTYKRNQETQLADRFRDRLAAEGIAEQDSSILARVHVLVAKLNGVGATSPPGHWLLRELGRAAIERDTGAGPTRDTFRQLDRAVNFIAFGDTQPANPSQRQREDVRLASGELLDRLPQVDGDLKAWNLQSRAILASVAADVPGASPQNVNKFMTDASTLAGVDAFTVLAPPPVSLARTIHDAKGETISAVMVVARKEDAEQWAAGAWLDDPPEHVSEEVRVAYVACTRCARMLVLAVPDATPTDTRQKLVEVGFIEA